MYNFNWELLGTWAGAIGAIITGLIAARLAWNQNKITKHQSNQEIITIYMQHYAKLMKFYSELNVVEILNNSMNAKSVNDREKFYTDLYYTVYSKLPQLRMIFSETDLFESDEIVGVNKELFSRFGAWHSALLFNKPEGEIYSSFVKVWDSEISIETTNKYKQAIDLLRKI